MTDRDHQDHPRTAAIIQARNGSSRFPRKVFADIAGRPLLGHILDRLRQARTLDAIIVATTTRDIDREILEFAAAEGVIGFAGDEDDVRGRYLAAAEANEVSVIVRICGDSPFIDPPMLDRMVSEVIAAKADYAEPDPSMPGAYEGMEVVTLDALRRARDLGDNGPDREHVTWYIRRHTDRFRVLHPHPTEVARGRFRLSIDTRADLDFVRSVFGSLYEPGRYFGAEALATFLRENPDIVGLNSHVTQKPADKKSLVIGVFVRDEADLSTALTLARRFTEEHHGGVRFFGPMAGSRRETLARIGYPAEPLDSLDDPAASPLFAARALAALVVPVPLIDKGRAVFSGIVMPLSMTGSEIAEALHAN